MRYKNNLIRPTKPGQVCRSHSAYLDGQRIPSIGAVLLGLCCWMLCCSAPIFADTRSGLSLHLDFEPNWLTNGQLQDKSGLGNLVDCQLAFSQCPTVSVGTDGSRAASFYGFTYNPASDGDYFAVQDHARFKNMNSGSISVWAKYNDGSTAGLLLDAWEYSVGTWRLGRYWRAKWPNEFSTEFIVAPERAVDAKDATRILFPDMGANNQWNLYVITWDGVLIKGYFNGAYVAQARQTGPLSTNRHYLSVGAFGHYIARNSPDPAHSTTFPNNGFLDGSLDDVRIYSRALLPADVYELYSRSAVAPACGNGNLNNGEECDDGNASAGDGCSQCRLEPGYSCSGTVCLRFPARLFSSLTEPVAQPGKYLIRLSWADMSANEDGFALERRSPGGTWQEVASVPANRTSFDDLVTVGTQLFYYRVRARRGSAYSNYSNIERVYPIESPRALTLSIIDSDSVKLSWEQRSTVPRTVLEFSSDGELWVNLQESLMSPSAQDSYSFQSGKTYYYRVCAFVESAKSCSGYSNIVSFSHGNHGGPPLAPSRLRILP